MPEERTESAAPHPEATTPVPLPAALVAGLFMGCADAVPGVSGGTMALILGIYRRFIAALDAVLGFVRRFRDPEARRQVLPALRLLVPLGASLLVGYLLTTKALVGKGEDVGLLQAPSSAPLCYAFFFGLVLFSIREPWRRIAKVSGASFGLAALGAATSFLVAGLPTVQTEPATWMLAYGGALAICVMLLPGISGSLLLLTLNQYQAISEAVHDLNLARVGTFVAGVVTGAALFIPLLKRLLQHRHDATMAVLSGLMLGSLRSLWPWKNQYDHKAGPMINEGIGNGWALALLMVALGGATIWLMARVESRLMNRQAAE